MKYKEFLEIWLEKYKKSEIKLTTYATYKLMINKFIVPELGEYELEELTKPILIDFLNKYKQKLSNSSLNGFISMLKISIRDANELDFTKTNETNILHRKAKKSQTLKTLTKEEAVKLTKYIIDYNCVNLTKRKHSIGILLALYTGLRLGEVLALKREDIDFKNQQIVVNKTFSQISIDGKLNSFISKPKTESSVRVVPIPKLIVPYLRKYLNSTTGDYFLTTAKGNPVSRRSMERIFTYTIKHLNLTPITFHGLRHTFATNLIEGGVDPKTVASILGHANIMITLNTYCHPSNIAKVTASNNWAKAIFSKLD